MVDHLADLGVGPVAPLQLEGRFPEAMQQVLAAAALVVAGKRGASAPADSRVLGGGFVSS